MPKPCDTSHPHYDNFTIGIRCHVVATALRWIYIQLLQVGADKCFSIASFFDEPRRISRALVDENALQLGDIIEVQHHRDICL